MGRTAILSLRIIGDAVGGVEALGDVDRAAGGMQRSLDTASRGAGVALGLIAGAATMAGNAASEAQQAAGGVDAVFGQLAGRVHQWAEDAADAVGLSEAAYGQLATVIGSQLKNMGLSLDDATGKTNDLVGLGADLAAQFGGTTADAVSALSSLLRGERDPIERYGVSINQAAIDAEKASLGLSGLTGEADKNANLQATLALLTRQTADAQGAFAREADTAAGAQQRASAEWDNTIAQLGESLLPLMTELAGSLQGVAQWVSQNTELVTFLVVTIAGLSAAVLIVNGALTAYRAAATVATAAQVALNFALSANPIGLVIIAIGLLIGIGLALAANWDEVSATADDVWGNITDWISDTIGWFQALFTWIGRISDAMNDAFRGGDWGAVGDLIGGGFSARMAVTPELDGSALSSRMMTFASAPAMTTMATTAAVAPTTARLSAAAASSDAQTVQAGDTYNITVNGAVDPDATARQLEGVLRRNSRRLGRMPAAGVGS